MNATPPRTKPTRWYPIVRQIHLWVGAWGAIAAILFGFSGVVLNHRFAMQLPQGERTPGEPVRITVPEAARATPEAMAQWLTQDQGMTPLMKRVRPAVPAGDGGNASEPEQWQFSGGSARDSWSADYAAGDASLEIERTHHDWLASLVRLHKSGGGGIAWIVLGDSFGIAMTLLGISGIAMWARGRRPRDMVVSVLAAAIVVIALVLGPGLL
ncbi:PepSY-associated TM helix domain-containing protein [Arenimonas oryziterrae]|uniref:Peptidase n=1 Tax=Arenimonas oryziterrae DSM 21050 = YC6267 TaxID=1121015 RepID=A0A091AXM1_9GAMM|nr:PepSY-associated TM helix domain-containing protein [Arenimonas oryziterrae]KFN45068.1 hypothetical protein N789_03335 [Arenimonas oryziterrae DSM 21050 = YC6267]